MNQASSFPFICEKGPAIGSQGMIVTNHPLASAAGAGILLEGGNAIDAAIASLFVLTVVEPMMVGILGGGVAHLRDADGRHLIIDGLGCAPAAAHETMYTPALERAGAQSGLPGIETVGRENLIGGKSVAVPGALAGWCSALERFGSFDLEDILAPAIRFAERGFIITPYLADCISDQAEDLARDPGLAARFLPAGSPLEAGERLVQAQYADTLRLVAKHGPAALYHGALGEDFVRSVADEGGLVDADDLAAYRVIDRDPICGDYRGFDILGPPPPASAGVHIVQMLNILEGFDLRRMGFGSADTTHLLAEVIKIAFADRSVATADPDFVEVPVDALIDKAYAALRRDEIDMAGARRYWPSIFQGESSSTTHITAVDAKGNAIATTQTINGLFGACFEVPKTGMIANNYLFNFDPRPGRALSIAPRKRVFTSMAPMMVRRDGRLTHALGLPGGLRIFPCAMQSLVNLIDHAMPLPEAVEAPRIWTQGGALEIEAGISDAVEEALIRRGHEVRRVKRIAGGMNAIARQEDGNLIGAACRRADGVPVGIGGGLARPGVRFSIR
ncbi:gamma-glutamyltransferase [Thioalkalivibrio sp. HK1]|uniref:gamma-glutamyltransferase n=1 Tax=Thioalkalivibrio sp. HK1 TaxID=1469245 RepID=UPI000470D005|nr:gamma-glutamyltransferase [Thioalkalivibrio sp. HK1]